MRTILMIPIIALSLIFELTGRILHQVSLMAMDVSGMLLRAISKNE